MKKILSILLSLCLLCLLAAGCATKPQDEGNNTPKAGTGKVDVDLTDLTSTLVYSEVYNMVNNPQDYLGKVIKVAGNYNASFSDYTKKYYHWVVVGDAAACCSQGLEFLWSGRHTYPDDYPIMGKAIELTGVYGSYEELDVTYYYLAVDSIKAL